MDWTERYRPRTLADLVGNGPAVKKLKTWAEAWAAGVPRTKAVVLAGPPGVGKTSAALALAADMDWAVIELNASDARNADRIKRVATAGALHQTFGDDGSFRDGRTPGEDGTAGASSARGASKLIILDEADNLYERLSGENAAGGATDLSDRGGKSQIIKTIRDTQQPIILIVNDLYSLTKGSGSALKSLAETIKWSRINVRSIPKALDRVAQAEGIRVDRDVLEAIASNAGGDLRAAVRDLQSLSAGRDHVTLQHLASTGYRDTEASIFDVVRHILKGKNLNELRREVMDVDATPDDLVLWVDENLGKEYQHPEDLVRGYEMLAKADRFLGRTRRTQNYRLWAYASNLATLGVMAVRRHEYRKFVPFGFPQWLSKMSRSRGARQLKDSLAESLGRATHQSKRKSRNDQVAVFEALFRADPEFAAHRTADMDLTADQVALLLDEKATSKAVKQVMEAAAAVEDARPASADGASPAGLGAFVADPEPAKPADAAAQDPAHAKPGAGEGQQRLF